LHLDLLMTKVFQSTKRQFAIKRSQTVVHCALCIVALRRIISKTYTIINIPQWYGRYYIIIELAQTYYK
jgi:hypothetical protein